jgi:hypothetical protein
MFNSPLEYCPRCCQYVALDLTQRECAAEHQCGKELCPLENHFMGMKAGSELTAPERPGGDEVPGLSPPADATARRAPETIF